MSCGWVFSLFSSLLGEVCLEVTDPQSTDDRMGTAHDDHHRVILDRPRGRSLPPDQYHGHDGCPADRGSQSALGDPAFHGSSPRARLAQGHYQRLGPRAVRATAGPLLRRSIAVAFVKSRSIIRCFMEV